MLGEPCELRVASGAGEYLSVPRGNDAPAFAFERLGHDRSPAARGAGLDDLVNKGHQLVGKSNGDLLAHPVMVPSWEHTRGAALPVRAPYSLLAEITLVGALTATCSPQPLSVTVLVKACAPLPPLLLALTATGSGVLEEVT